MTGLEKASDAVTAWLEAGPHSDLHLARGFLRSTLLEFGLTDGAATSVAMVPRNPFVQRSNWRLAHAAEIDHQRVPSPLRLGRMLDGLYTQTGECLAMVEERAGWSSVVCGVFAAVAGIRPFTTARAPRQAALAGCLRTLGVQMHVDLGDLRPAAIVVAGPVDRPSSEILAGIPEGGRMTWSTAGETDRIYRVQRRHGEFRLTDMGAAK